MRWLGGLLAFTTPLWIYLGLSRFEPRPLLLAVAALLVGRMLLRARRPDARGLRQLAVVVAAAAAVFGVAWLWNDPVALLLLPTGMNLALGFGFARTLRSGRPLVETFARMQVDDLSPSEVRYCRRVTEVWVVFFAINAALSAMLAFGASREVWLLYTGLIAYLAVGVLFACEFSVRAWRFGRHEGTLVAPLYDAVFGLLGHRAPRGQGP